MFLQMGVNVNFAHINMNVMVMTAVRKKINKTPKHQRAGD